MTLTIHLSHDLERQLAQEAARLGKSADGFAREVLEERLKLEQIERNKAAIALLQTWMDEGDELEQRETGDFLIKALDEDRLSGRKLFQG